MQNIWKIGRSFSLSEKVTKQLKRPEFAKIKIEHSNTGRNSTSKIVWKARGDFFWSHFWRPLQHFGQRRRLRLLRKGRKRPLQYQREKRKASLALPSSLFSTRRQQQSSAAYVTRTSYRQARTLRQPKLQFFCQFIIICLPFQAYKT